MHSAFEERRRGCKNLSGDVGDDLWQQLRIRTMIEGSLEVKLPTIWTDEKQRWEESERREE